MACCLSHGEMASEDSLQRSGESCVADEDLLQMFGRISGCSDVDIEDVSQWLRDNNDSSYGIMTDEEIITACTSMSQEADSEGVIAPQQMTHTDATVQLDIMAYLERHHSSCCLLYTSRCV